MLTNNYVVLNKTFNSVGSCIHRAETDQLVDITFQRCIEEDFANEESEVKLRVNVGAMDVALYYKFDATKHTFTINNIPVYKNQEVWICINKPHSYCAFGKFLNTN